MMCAGAGHHHFLSSELCRERGIGYILYLTGIGCHTPGSADLHSDRSPSSSSELGVPPGADCVRLPDRAVLRVPHSQRGPCELVHHSLVRAIQQLFQGRLRDDRLGQTTIKNAKHFSVCVLYEMFVCMYVCMHVCKSMHVCIYVCTTVFCTTVFYTNRCVYRCTGVQYALYVY